MSYFHPHAKSYNTFSAMLQQASRHGETEHKPCPITTARTLLKFQGAHTYMHTCIHTQMTQIPIYLHTYIPMCLHGLHTYILTYTHIYIYKHDIHTYIQTDRQTDRHIYMCVCVCVQKCRDAYISSTLLYLCLLFLPSPPTSKTLNLENLFLESSNLQTLDSKL